MKTSMFLIEKGCQYFKTLSGYLSDVFTCGTTGTSMDRLYVAFQNLLKMFLGLSFLMSSAAKLDTSLCQDWKAVRMALSWRCEVLTVMLPGLGSNKLVHITPS